MAEYQKILEKYSLEDMEEIPCGICDGNEFDTLAFKDKRGVPVHTVICKNCGLIFLCPRLSQKALDNFYKNDNSAYVQKIPRTMEEIHASLVRKGMVYLDFVKDYIDAKCKVMEIGCGSGGVLQPFKEAGYECVGIEPMEDYGDFARKHVGIEIITDFIESSDFNYGKVDLVIISDALNHFRSPSKVFFKINELLNLGGKIFIAEKDPVSFATWDNFNTISHFDHLYAFTPRSVFNLLKKTGFFLVKHKDKDKKYWILAERKDIDYEVNFRDCNLYRELKKELKIKGLTWSIKGKIKKIFR